LLYPATFVVCGLDARFGCSPPIRLWIEGLALMLFSAGYGFALWATYSNPFFSTFVRIQRERGHHVIDRGPYAFVRHPGYAGAVVAHLVLPIALGSLLGLVPAVLGVVLIALRAVAEERTLALRLPGYREYAGRVRWRFVPGVW
jgi:protein-S-isoprenylcysteine O-methyltransferase Ste14